MLNKRKLVINGYLRCLFGQTKVIFKMLKLSCSPCLCGNLSVLSKKDCRNYDPFWTATSSAAITVILFTNLEVLLEPADFPRLPALYVPRKFRHCNGPSKGGRCTLCSTMHFVLRLHDTHLHSRLYVAGQVDCSLDPRNS